MRAKRDGRLVPVLFLVGAMLCFGTVPIYLRLLRDHVDKWTVNAFRYSVGALFWLPCVVVLSRRRKREQASAGRSVWRDALGVAAVNLAGQVGWGAAPYYVDAPTIGFAIRLSFLFAALFGFLCIRQERLLGRRPLFWVGATLCVVGVTAMFLPRLGSGSGDRERQLVGVAILVGTAACWGAYAVGVQRLLGGYPVRLAFGVISLYTTAGLVVLMILRGEPMALAGLSATLWACLVGSAFLGIAFGHVLYYRALHGLGSVVSSGMLMGQPFITLTAAAIVLGETLAPAELGGGLGVVLGGVLLVAAKAQTERRSPAPR